MVRFFKLIKKKLGGKNRQLQFFKYAFTEIVLVVFGILIAVYINNWNEAKIKHAIEVELLEELLDDTKADEDFFKSRFFHLASYLSNVKKLNAIDRGNTTDSIINSPFNNYRIFDIGMAYQSTVILNNNDKVEEFTNKKIQELLRKYILQHNYITIAFAQKDKYFDKYAGDLLLKYSDVSFNLQNSTPLKDYYKIIEYPKNKKVVNFLRASVLNCRIQVTTILKINAELKEAISNELKNK